MTELITNGGFEVDTSGWTASGGASIARSTVEAFAGVASLRVTNAAANDGTVYTRGAANPSKLHAISAAFRLDTTEQVGFGWNEYTSADGYIRTVQDQPTLTGGGWVEASIMFRTRPTCGKIEPFFSIRNSGVDFYLDAASVEEQADTALQQAILALSPISWWDLNERAGSAVDCMSGVTGSLVNTPVRSGPLTFKEVHELSRSLRFDNSDGDAISFGDVYDFVGSAQFTALAFLKPIAYNSGSGHSIWSNEDVSSRGWSLRLANPAVRWTMSRGDNAGFDNVTYDMTEAVYENGSIVRMVAMRYDGTNLILHMNGDDVAQGLSSKTLVAATTNTSLRFGSYSAGGSGYDGYADDLVIWDRCLSLAELRTIWNASYPRADVALRGI